MQSVVPDEKETSEAFEGQTFERVTHPTLSRMLREGVEQGVYPGAVLLVTRGGEIVHREAVGEKCVRSARHPDPLPMNVETVFDVASVTAGVVTTTLLMKLVELDRLRLEERVSRHLPGFGILGKSSITVGHLASHTSGLAPWHPYYEELVKEHPASRAGVLTSRTAHEYILNSILRIQLKGDVGGRYLYSDIGLTVIGALIEQSLAMPLDRALFRFVASPLGMKSSSYIDIGLLKRRGLEPVTEMIAPTEECPWRKKLVWGEVHDDNAWAMGGVAAHAGLFSTAEDLSRFGNELLEAHRGRSSYLSRETLRLFLAGQECKSGQTVKFGWDTPSKENGMADSGLKEGAFGYNGFTGCSLWMEPEREVVVVLMSNRIHPTRNNKKILNFRPELFRAILQAL